ncbi:hypothetical protein V496_02199 [Pseudogymnoascus sp. VKM F-4515 (FW-2607)]|nr:hypothetical protein V496_02199 [Pseudogymnoascus sp. VKM F-4515 (FW-2607)]KFY97710.1 hypothetical protein V498_01906 [Pseudogymnoascus sp. VKM F-4517 (FW-2822)]
MLSPLPQECLLCPEDGDYQITKGDYQITKRPNTSAMEEVPSPFRDKVALDQLKKGGNNTIIEQPEFPASKPASFQTSPGPRLPLTSITISLSSPTPLAFSGPRRNTSINHTPAYSSTSYLPRIPSIDTPSAADLKGKSTAYPVYGVPTFPTAAPPGNSNEALTESRTWGEEIPREMEIHPPKVRQPVASQPAPRRGRGIGGGQPQPRRWAVRAKSAASSIPGSSPIPVPYRRIENAQGKPIFRKAEHDREGLAGMIGVTREEWYLGLRTPVYAPPSDGMRLRVLQSESEMAKKIAWVKETVGYQARREEEVELERRVHADIMKVGWAAFNERLRAEEVMMGIPTLDIPVLRMDGSGMGSRSKDKATF